MSLLADYRAVTGSPTAVLNSIVNAPINALNDADRAELIQALVDDIVAARASQTSRLNQKEAGLALAAIKSLGRVEAGSRVIATEQNLRHFLAFASDLKDADASKQAMRCIANAILLIPAGRDTLVDIQGDEFCTRLYINESTSPEYLFLASRLLFFMCHTDGEFISRVVRQHRLPNLLAQRLESLGSAVQSETPFAKDALTDMLKVHFTAVAKYTKLVGQESNSVLGEYWDDVFEPTAAPLIKLLHTLPSTPANPIAAPLTYAIHALLNVPVTPFAHLWFPTTSEPSPRTSRSSSSGGQSPRPSIDKSSPTSGDTSPLARALNLLNRKSSPGRGSKAPRDSAMRALTLLTQLFAIHLPGTSDPDDSSVRSAARTRGIVVDELGSAIVALVTRLAADEGARSRIHAVLFPADLDRTTPLEKKDDLLGRCIRLMTSVYYPTLKDAVGEMLFVICGSDGQALSAAIGYGNAAGFLYNKGIMAPPPDQTEDGVNPITGTRTTDAGPSLEEMTEEEKQREAERLFVLFDRMERMGMAKNPIREAYQSGKLQD